MPTNTELRQQASEILQGADFQRYRTEEQGFDLMKWLRDHFNWKLPVEEKTMTPAWEITGVIIKWLLILMLVAAVGYLLYRLYRYFARRISQENETFALTPAQRLEAHASYTQMANDAIKNGDYRKAIHYLFLATVMLVIKDAYFKVSEFMTNRELAEASDFSQFAQSQSLRSAFQEMVYFDEPRWFGEFPASEDDYQQFIKTYQVFHQQVGRHAS